MATKSSKTKSSSKSKTNASKSSVASKSSASNSSKNATSSKSNSSKNATSSKSNSSKNATSSKKLASKNANATNKSSASKSVLKSNASSDFKLAKTQKEGKAQSINLANIEAAVNDGQNFFYFDKENTHKQILALVSHFEKKGFSVYERTAKYGLDADDYVYEVYIL